MRIAYAVQGTGNGHIARARELIPLLLERPNLVLELPTEALFHGKRLAVIPIRGQYEQACNAEALRREGAWVAHNLKDMPLAQWLQSPAPPAKKWPNYGRELIDRMLGTLSARHPSTLRPQRCICSSDRSRCETRAAMSCAHKRRVVGLLDRIHDRRRGAS